MISHICYTLHICSLSTESFLRHVEVRLQSEGFATPITVIGFFPSVGFFMLSKVSLLDKSPVTKVTLVSLHASMDSLMIDGISFLGKSLLTQPTFVRFLSCVCSLVFHKGRLANERLHSLCTGWLRFLVSVFKLAEG